MLLKEIRTGTDVFSTFEKLKKESTMKGIYDGTFATCRFNGVALQLKGMFKKTNKKIAEEHIFNHYIGNKGEAYAVDMGIDHYEIVKASVVPAQDVTPVYRFLVKSPAGNELIYAFEKLDDAKALVTEYAKNTGEALIIEKCNIKGDAYKNFYTNIEVIVRKSKPAIVPKDAGVREVHKYYFYGYVIDS